MAPRFLSLLAGPRRRMLEELFARLCAAPDDDEPRRAVARLLARSGHVARAALITAQLDLATASAHDPMRATLAELARTLLAEHGAAWRRDELPQLPGITWGDFERGFPRSLEVAEPDVLIRLGAEVCASAPIEHIRVRNLRLPQLRRLLEMAHLARIREVDLSDNVLGVAGAKALGSVDARWQRLNLARTELGPLGSQALLRPPLMARLEALDISGNKLGAAGAAAAAGAALAAAAALQELNLAENEWNDHPLQGLVRSAALPKLRRLVLRNNRIGDDGVRALASHRGWSDLAALDLRANPIGDAGVLALAESPHLPALTELRLGENRVGKRALTTLLRSPRCARLRALDLVKAEPGEESLRWIATLGTLTALDLSHNHLHAADLRPIAASPQMARLEVLRLRDTRLGPAGARLIADSPYLVGLAELDVTNSGLVAEGARALLTWPGLPRLRVLRVGENAVPGDLLQALREGCGGVVTA